MPRDPRSILGFRRADAGGGESAGRPLRPVGGGLGGYGMGLFFASLAMLFIPLLFVYYFLRQRYAVWPPAGIRPPVVGFLIATILMASVSLALHMAMKRLQGGDARRFQRGIQAAAFLALGFLLCQAVNWVTLFETGFTDETWAIIGFLYFFTAVHALHVIGGVGPLTLVALRARAGRYSPVDCNGPRYVAMYWHFLDVVWLVMLAAFLIP